MKKISYLLILSLLMNVLTTISFAKATQTVSIILDGYNVDFGDEKPFYDTASGDIFVPLRNLAEELRATVNWDSKTQSIEIKSGKRVAIIRIGDNIVQMNEGDNLQLNKEAFLKSGKTFVPLKFFEEFLDLEVGFSMEDKKVTIDSKLALLNGVSHYSQSTIKIEGEKVIYIDPINILGEEKDADIVFITHVHSDHYKAVDINKVLKEDGFLIVPASAFQRAKDDGFKNIIPVETDIRYVINDISFEVIPAYNIDKTFHPKERGWVGYNIEINKIRYYFSGDTDIIPEMGMIKTDVVFLPIGGTYTMDALEAAKAANMIKPKVAVPVHYRDLVGNIDDAKKFVDHLDEGIMGVILKDMATIVNGITHYHHSFIRIAGTNKVVYFDPYQVKETTNDGDIVFITHSHSDHFVIDDIKKVAKEDALIVLPESAVQKAQEAGFENLLIVVPNELYEVNGISIKTVPAYNIEKTYHPRGRNWVGYIIEMNNTTYYISGDTEVIPEMKEIKADIVFLPVGGIYTMTAEEAASAVNWIQPSVAIPIHFGYAEGTREDAERFIRLLNKNIKGIILSEE